MTINKLEKKRKLCFVRSNCYPGDTSKDKRIKVFRNFKIVDGHLIYKMEKGVIFVNDRKAKIPQYPI